MERSGGRQRSRSVDWEAVARETWEVLGPAVRGNDLRVRRPEEIARLTLREWREEASWYEYRDEEVVFLHRLACRLAGRTLRGRRRK